MQWFIFHRFFYSVSLIILTLNNSDVAGHKLPATATNGFNLLAIGLLCSIAGGALLIIRKRKLHKQLNRYGQ